MSSLCALWAHQVLLQDFLFIRRLFLLGEEHD